MSSTNRGYDRHVSDYYVTPINHIIPFLKEFENQEGEFDGIILDSSAGGDSKHTMSYPFALLNVGVESNLIKTIDIREDSLAEIKGDYLKMELGYRPKYIVTNPPFLLAREFIEKALNDVEDGGFVIMLLRLNFFGSKKRKDLFEKHMPKYCFVHHVRMSFTDDGKTDSVEYAHFVWQKGYTPQFTKLKVI